MDPKQVVADGYDRLHALYADWTSERRDRLRHQYIDKVFDLGQAAPRSALDLGCGTGRHATAYLVSKGLQVTGVDISGASVEVATGRWRAPVSSSGTWFLWSCRRRPSIWSPPSIR